MAFEDSPTGLASAIAAGLQVMQVHGFPAPAPAGT